MQNELIVKGARSNNLKSVNVAIPRDKLVVFTGLSGSGKSSLAFDTIYAEGQRRYVESLSSYARQFLGQMDKPDVDAIEGLSPAISIDQKTTSNNPRSTVGTVTEVHDYLRLLYANIGVPHCPKCGRAISRQTVDQMVDAIAKLGEGKRIQVLAPLVRGRKGEHVKVFDTVRKQGFVRVRADGETYDVSAPPKLDKKLKHTIAVVVDRLVLKGEGDKNSRLFSSIETALDLSGGIVEIDAGGELMTFSQNYACPDCGISMEELTPRMFSFNNPYGACPTCTGLGFQMKIDPDLVIPNRNLSLNEGAINVSGWNSSLMGGQMAAMYFGALSKHYGFSLDTPVKDLPKKIVDIILYGTGEEKIEMHFSREYGSGTIRQAFEGIATNLERRYRETTSDWAKEELEGYMSYVPCPDCHGDRLKKTVLAVTVGGKSIAEVSKLSVLDARAFFRALELTETERLIAGRI